MPLKKQKQKMSSKRVNHPGAKKRALVNECHCSCADDDAAAASAGSCVNVARN